MIELKGIKKKYEIEDKKEILALDDVNFEFPEKGFFAIYGRSGCGKTTLLNIIGGVDKPSEGTVLVNGTDINAASGSKVNSYRNWDVSYIYQDYNLISRYNVIDNIKLPLRFQFNDEHVIEQKAKEALKTVGLDGCENRQPKHLSGGQQQRVAIARAIAKDAKIILCDEPTGNLDIETAYSIMQVLKDISKERLVIIVTHDKEMADEFCEQIINLKEGRINETHESLKNHTETATKSAEERNNIIEKKGSLSLKNTFRYAFLNLIKDRVAAIVALIILIGSFSIMIALNCMSNYNEIEATYKTLEANNVKIIALNTYKGQMNQNPDGEQEHAMGMEMDIREDEMEDIEALVGRDATIDKSFLFIKTLDDFSEDTDFVSDRTHDNTFNEFVAVEDFNNSELELLLGDYPKEKNQVLIYDYMAYNILEQGKFKGVTKFEDLIGYTMKDVHTGFTMRISGLIKSNYKKCLDEIKTERPFSETVTISFEDKYIGMLRSIWGLSSFVEEIKKESDYQSIEEKYFFNPITNATLSDKDNKPVRLCYEIPKKEYIGNVNKNGERIGVILSRKKFAEIMGVDESEINENYVNVEMRDVFLMLSCVLDFKDYDKGLATSEIIAVIGVYEGDSDEVLLYQNSKEDGAYVMNGEFRQFYCEMHDNERQIIEKLFPEEKNAEYYLSHPNEIERGISMYTPYKIIIDNSTVYVGYVQGVEKIFLILAVIFISIGLFAFGIANSHRNRYEIGVYKSLGAKNSTIAIVFGMELVILVITAMIISLFVSRFIVYLYDYIFTRYLVVEAHFFSVSGDDYIFPVLGSLGITFLAIAASLIKLFKMQPINIIKNGKK